jgi:hypothetical protein
MYLIAFVATAAVYFLLVLHKLAWYRKWKDRIKPKDIHHEDAD